MTETQTTETKMTETTQEKTEKVDRIILAQSRPVEHYNYGDRCEAQHNNFSLMQFYNLYLQ